MKIARNCMLTLLALLALGMTARAQDASTRTQDAPARETSRAAGPAVTISVTERGVRFAALGSFGKMRLEVFNADGTSLYNSDFAASSVRDWALDDKEGQRLADGTYLCVITMRELSGRLITKQGSVVLQGGQPSLKLPDGESVEVVEQDKSLARVTDPADTALTLVGHDGESGQVVNTRGALTFRFGDFFGGKDHELMRLTPEGNLGLGVKSPRAKLDVAGMIRAGGIEFPNGTVQTTGLSGLVNAQGNIVPAASGSGTQGRVAKWTDNSGALGDSVITETSTGFVGFSNANPTAKLSVLASTGAEARFDAGAAAITPVLSVISQPTSTTQGGASVMTAGTGGSGFVFSDNLPFVIVKDTKANVVNNNLGNGTILAVVTPGGSLGIGTTNPQSLLDVNGNFNVTGNATVSGNIAAKYQDIAEWTSARTKLPSGTVVSLDTLKPNSVLASNKAYDTRVAGVVSAQPGVILGVGGPNRVLVATTGRVKVRVNANRYPIKIGDLLVTSNTPGVAMKSEPFRLYGRTMHRPGTIIGKALEPLSTGEGTILVLLSLQ